ncbi:MAG: DUF1569 domain-containing protein [Aquirufa sp.]
MINKLAIQLREMQDLSEHWEKKNPDVSVETVGWHLLHNLKVINGMIVSLAASDPNRYSPKFSVIKWRILLTKKIPRGKARAPKSAMPMQIDKAELDAALDQASLSILNLLNQSPKQYFTHPMFGDLNTKLTSRFLWIHTEHHLKIVRDILR